MSPHNGWEWLRLLTPVLTAVSLFIIGQIWVQLNDLNMKLYSHVTNAEMHIPRSEFVAIQAQLTDMRKEIITTIRGEK